jgi:hypothetical protein
MVRVGLRFAEPKDQLRCPGEAKRQLLKIYFRYIQ